MIEWRTVEQPDTHKLQYHGYIHGLRRFVIGESVASSSLQGIFGMNDLERDEVHGGTLQDCQLIADAIILKESEGVREKGYERDLTDSEKIIELLRGILAAIREGKR